MKIFSLWEALPYTVAADSVLYQPSSLPSISRPLKWHPVCRLPSCPDSMWTQHKLFAFHHKWKRLSRRPLAREARSRMCSLDGFPQLRSCTARRLCFMIHMKNGEAITHSAHNVNDSNKSRRAGETLHLIRNQSWWRKGKSPSKQRAGVLSSVDY